MSSVMLVLMALTLAGPVGGQVKLQDDKPIASKPAAGDLSGQIEPADQIADLTAVSRTTGKTCKPDAFDRKTGRFTFKAMPGDAQYDVCIDTSDGRRYEGIDLDFVDQRLLDLAAARRAALGLPAAKDAAFEPADLTDLLKWVKDWDDFMDLRRPLYISGQGPRATMLVELLRTREFHQSGGKCVWRVELWDFERHAGAWDRVANEERVLRRERIDPADWKKTALEYWPDLTSRVAADGTSKPVRFTIPKAADPSRGRPANTDPDLKTDPHVIGLDTPATQPANTQPSK